MRNSPAQLARLRLVSPLEAAICLATLALLASFTYVYMLAPHPGFIFDTEGQVISLSAPQQAGASLEAGDHIVRIGQVTWEDYKEKRQPFFSGLRPGQSVAMVVERDGEQIDLTWAMPAMSGPDWAARLFNIWIIGYVFWAVGTLAVLVVRPRDARWMLLVAFNFLTAIWIVAGSLSSTRLLGSAVIMRAGIWLCVPVYLLLHWVFPRPLGRLPLLAALGLGLLGLGLAAAEAFLLLPSDAYFYGFLLAVLGSLALLAIRFLVRPADRPTLGLMLAAAAIAVGPVIVLSFAGLGAGINSALAGALLGLPVLPLTYLYVIYRRSMGGLELRVNRAISFYLLLVVLLPAAALAYAMLTLWIRVPSALAGLLVVGLVAWATVFGFARFQKFVERRLLGIPPVPDQLLADYSERIAASLRQPDLLEVLRQRVLAGLPVQQSAMAQVDGVGQLRTLYSDQVDADQLPKAADMVDLLAAAGQYRPPNMPGSAPCRWARVVLPLTLNGRLHGLWLLGRRPPDDYYSLAEIQALKAIAHQTAIALSHAEQAETMRRLVGANIDQAETERTRLARDLHDHVLSEITSQMVFLDDAGLHDMVKRFQALTGSIRDTISDLRPPVLDLGLWHALSQMADDLEDESGLEVRLEVAPSEARYDPYVELHLYRLVKQACDNARKHARASRLTISGSLGPNHVALQVQDDGVGFTLDPAVSLEQHLSQLVQAQHYGLAGMVERATLIDADLRIDAQPGRGVTVSVHWAGHPQDGAASG